MKDREEIESYRMLLADYLTNYLAINIRKPFRCLNPDHLDLHPSMRFSSKYNICKCFSCGVSYDIFDIIGLDYSVSSFADKLRIVNELYPDLSNIKTEDNSDEVYEIIDYKKYFNKCLKNINKTDYLSRRGISNRLIKKYKIGYDEDKKMIIIPINNNAYFGRSAINNSKIKSKGKSYLWNEKLLHSESNNLIYVTESIFDSLSLEEIDKDVKTISLNGVSNYNRLLKVVEDNNYEGYLVLAFDNDKVGLSYQEIVKEELSKIGVSSFSSTLISNMSNEKVKDLNEALLKNKDRFKKNYNYFNESFKQIINSRNKEKGDEIKL